MIMQFHGKTIYTVFEEASDPVQAPKITLVENYSTICCPQTCSIALAPTATSQAPAS